MNEKHTKSLLIYKIMYVILIFGIKNKTVWHWPYFAVILKFLVLVLMLKRIVNDLYNLNISSFFKIFLEEDPRTGPFSLKASYTPQTTRQVEHLLVKPLCTPMAVVNEAVFKLSISNLEPLSNQVLAD